MKQWRLPVAVLVAGALAIAIAYFVKRNDASPAITQPIAFNHQRHLVGATAPKLACTECHAGAENGTSAGLPSLDRCLQCHMKPQSQRAEEGAVRAAAARGGAFAWTPVTRNAAHVFFSHRAHVTAAKISCTSCHGDVAGWTEPPARPEPRLLNMSVCLDCHRERGASTTCSTCHR
jgi:hypothetical protein